VGATVDADAGFDFLLSSTTNSRELRQTMSGDRESLEGQHDCEGPSSLHVRGDGKRYRLNLRTSEGYQAAF
jgi:hypothetical protein